LGSEAWSPRVYQLRVCDFSGGRLTCSVVLASGVWRFCPFFIWAIAVAVGFSSNLVNSDPPEEFVRLVISGPALPSAVATVVIAATTSKTGMAVMWRSFLLHESFLVIINATASHSTHVQARFEF